MPIKKQEPLPQVIPVTLAGLDVQSYLIYSTLRKSLNDRNNLTPLLFQILHKTLSDSLAIIQ